MMKKETTCIDKLDLAERLEHMAADIYTLIAERLPQDEAARQVFTRLAEEEVQHAIRIRMLRTRYLGNPKAFGEIILDVNDVFLMGSGYQRDELMGKSFRELNAISNMDHVQTIEDKLAQYGRVQNKQIDLRTKSGDVLPTLLSATVMELSGEPSVLVIVKDHSTQIRTEEKLKRSEERFRKTFENAPIGIMLIDSEGRIFQVNNYASELLEYDNEALLSRYISELLPEGQRTDLKQTLETLLTSKTSVDLADRELQCLSGRTISTNCHIVLQRSDTGNPLYFIVQIADITELKNSHQKMERFAFYERAKQAFAIVQTGEERLYGNIMITKGVCGK